MPRQMTYTTQTRPDQWLYDTYDSLVVSRAKAALREQNRPFATPTDEVRRLCEVMSLPETERDEAIVFQLDGLHVDWHDGFVAAAAEMRAGRR